MVDEDIAEDVKTSVESLGISVDAIFPRDRRVASANLSGQQVPLLPDFLPSLRDCTEAILNKVKEGAS